MSRELDILNYCMEAVGERAVTDASSTHPTAQKARRIIQRMNRKLQTKGWWFNRDYGLPLSPQPTGEIILPSNTLKITPMRPLAHLVRRDGRFYDPVKHTYNIGQLVRTTIVWELSIDDLPITAYNHLEAVCALTMFAADDGDASSIQSQDLARDVNLTRSELRAEELKESRVNSKTRPTVAALRGGALQHILNHNVTRRWE